MEKARRLVEGYVDHYDNVRQAAPPAVVIGRYNLARRGMRSLKFRFAVSPYVFLFAVFLLRSAHAAGIMPNRRLCI